MEIDASPVAPQADFSDIPDNIESESSLNFDYLQDLQSIPSDSAASMGSQQHGQTPRHFRAVADGEHLAINGGQIDNSRVMDRFVTVLDQLDARVEKFRKDALGLQEKRDFLLMSIDLIKSNELMQNLSESEKGEILYYIQRINFRLSTVELNVRTIRDRSQEESLSQINSLIDTMIIISDPVLSRQRCQMYLNACCSAGETDNMPSTSSIKSYRDGCNFDMDAGPVDKKFESVLLGCTLDDQKIIKKRLQALIGYLNKQIVHR